MLWKAGIGRAGILACLLTGQSGPASADQFRHLSGQQIKARFAGKMLTDETHWRETYLPGGRLVAEQMGGVPMTGTWRVDHDQLCTLLPGVRDACYAVWASGDRIELRHAGSPTVEAFLRQPRQPSAR
jgi:hypothetical protein